MSYLKKNVSPPFFFLKKAKNSLNICVYNINMCLVLPIKLTLLSNS